MIRHWTPEEDAIILEGRRTGVGFRDLGARLERSPRAVECRHAKIREVQGAQRPKWRKDRLLIALNEAFHKFAGENCITAEEARILLMGDRPQHAAPGTETFLKTSAMRRLAA